MRLIPWPVAGQATQLDFASVDSAPKGYAVQRSPLVCPTFLAVFGLGSLVAVLSISHLESAYVELISALTGTREQLLAPAVSIGLRPFFVVFFVSLSAFVAGSVHDRLRFLLAVGGGYLIASLLLDAVLWELDGTGHLGPFSTIGNILDGYLGVTLLGVALMFYMQLPPDVRVETRIIRPWRYTATFVGTILVSAVLAFLAAKSLGPELDMLRSVALLGGLGPGILLFMPLLTFQTALFGFLSLRRRPLSQPLSYSVAFLIPAFNEAHGIGDCIRSIDRAAARYGGPCRLYVVDNGSRDNTAEVARREIEACHVLTGQVLSCPEPGKAIALNFGLAHITEDIVVRVDADSLIADDALVRLLPYFAEPDVGGVGGLPLPKESSFLSSMRAIEVYTRIGFGRVALGAVDAVMVIPGILSAYRRDLMVEADGFITGMNGEDTDLSIRIGRMGYRIATDPSIRVLSEVPQSFRHLREQRLRWLRSAFHVMSRNKSAMWMRQGVRGLWMIPWTLVQAVRRPIVVPILIYAGIVAVANPDALFLKSGAAVGAVILGSSIIVQAVVLILYRRPDLLPLLPGYLGFRLLRNYFALEVLFTLPLRPRGAGPLQIVRGAELSLPAPQLQPAPEVVRNRLGS